MMIEPGFADEDYCYLTTVGRATGRTHEIEIWFALSGSTVYMLNGDSVHAAGRADWVRNLQKRPAVNLRIRDRTFGGEARIVTDAIEEALARRLLLEKYQPGYGGDLTSWGRTGLPVAVDLQLEGSHDVAN